MDRRRLALVETHFHAALSRPPEERAAYLDRHCLDPGLRADVERLIADDEAGVRFEPGRGEARTP